MPRRRLRLPLWRRWWRHPDQAFLRQEVRFGLRWWFRSPGIWLMGLILLPAAVSQVLFVTIVPSDMALAAVFPFIHYPISMLAFCTIVAVWINLSRHRSLFLFKGQNFEEILATPIHPRTIFPSLLLAPVTALITKDFVSAVVTLLIFGLTISKGLAAAAATGDLTVFNLKITSLQFMLIPLNLVCQPFYLLALNAWVVSKTLPRTSILAVLAWSALGAIRIMFVPILLSTALVALASALGNFSKFDNMLIITTLVNGFIAQLVMLLVSIRVWRASLARLRDPALLIRLRDSIEPPQPTESALPFPVPEPATQA